MSKKYLALLACLLIYLNLSSGLTNHDFCMKQKNYCSGSFSHYCKPDKCSIDRKSCSYFNSLVFVSNIYRFRQNYEKEKKKFNEFKSKITNCSLPKYKWNSSDICLNHVNCIEISLGGIIWSREKKSVYCQCAGKHLYQCDKNVCSIDQISCDHYKTKNKTEKLTITFTNCKKMYFFTYFF